MNQSVQAVRFRWEIVGGIGVFLLMLAVQFGAMVWYESDRNTALNNLSDRVTKLEIANGKDALQLASIDKQLGSVTGQLQQISNQLSIVTEALISPENHIGRARQ